MIFERNRQNGVKRNCSYVEREFDRLQPKRAFFERGVIPEEAY